YRRTGRLAPHRQKGLVIYKRVLTNEIVTRLPVPAPLELVILAFPALPAVSKPPGRIPAALALSTLLTDAPSTLPECNGNWFCYSSYQLV
ncbi:MAG: hypothetical protein KDA47_17200, partial [Planctomycetales bacterium]|nr:hypothetical protein [Planctomycetales bacterium]